MVCLHNIFEANLADGRELPVGNFEECVKKRDEWARLVEPHSLKNGFVQTPFSRRKVDGQLILPRDFSVGLSGCTACSALLPPSPFGRGAWALRRAGKASRRTAEIARMREVRKFMVVQAS